MNWSNNKFYNLRISLLQGNKIIIEQGAISDMTEKDGIYYFDVFIYRWQKSFVYDQIFIKEVYDELTQKRYTDINDFIQAFKGEGATQPPSITPLVSTLRQHIVKTRDIFLPIWSELLIMLFMARIDIDNKQLKEDVIYDYIVKHISSEHKISRAFMRKAMSKIELTKDDFYKALLRLKTKSQPEIIEFYQNLLKICLSDGRMHYSERLYLAEIVQFFRLQNINLV